MLLKVKGAEDTMEDSVEKENKQIMGNIPAKVEKGHMDILSNDGPGLKTKEFGKFPLKKQVRKERGLNNACPAIQLF